MIVGPARGRPAIGNVGRDSKTHEVVATWEEADVVEVTLTAGEHVGGLGGGGPRG